MKRNCLGIIAIVCGANVLSNADASLITFEGFQDLNRPDSGAVLADATLKGTAVAQQAEEIARAAFGMAANTSFGNLLDAVNIIQATLLGLKVEQADDLDQLHAALTDGEALLQERQALQSLANTTDRRARDYVVPSLQALSPSLDVSIGVTLDARVRTEAQATLADLRKGLKQIPDLSAAVTDLKSMAQKASEVAELADKVGGIFLGVPLLGVPDAGAKLIGQASGYRELSGDSAVAARALEALQKEFVQAKFAYSSVIAQYESALSHDLAYTNFDFEMAPIGNSACGFDISLSPTPVVRRGVQAEVFQVGGLNVFSRPDLDGTTACSGSIDILATRTISGVPGFQTLVSSGLASLVFHYVVLLGTGFDNIIIPSLGKGGNVPVGDSRMFPLIGSIASPFQIIDFQASPGDPADAVFTVASVDEPGTSSLFFGAVLCLLARQARRFGIRGSSNRWPIFH